MATANRKQVWLIRHGETEWTQTGQHTGRTDVPLLEVGKQRALALGRVLSGIEFDLVLTSPLERARETCRLAGFGDRAQTTGDLAEWDYGIFEGRTTAQIRVDRPGWSIWKTDVPQGETIDQVAARANRLIETALAAKGNVALFGHGHILRITAACWLSLDADNARLFALDPGGISILGYEHETKVMRAWNRSV